MRTGYVTTATTKMSNHSLVSIIIPCRNEEEFIRRCLDSIIAQDYPQEKLEVIVVDGMSDDGTRDILKNYIRKHKNIRVLDNPKKITPCALNIGIQNSQGDLIVWMSAHNEYEKEYVSKCVKYLVRFNADAVGGIIKASPRKASLVGKLICTAISHPFGVGKSIHKIGSKKPQWVDTAFGVCYKREIFKKVGIFNENLVRGQDMEFSLRLKKAGLKTLLSPDIVSYYYPRTEFKSFIKQNFTNGVWAILPFKYSSIMPISWRHLVPVVFVSSIIISGALSIFFQTFFWLFLSIIGSYFLVNIYFSTKIFIKKRNLIYLFIMPIIFASLHMGYGLGSMWGVLKIIVSKQFWTNFRFILKKS